MQEGEIRRIESKLGIALPEAYRAALVQLEQSDVDLPEFLNDADQIIELNSHFTLDPEDLSELRGTGILGRFRFFLFFKSPSKLIEQRTRYKQQWAGGGRLIIGTDLGEEQYFIHLRPNDQRVYCHELETDAIREVAPNLPAWVSQARAAAASPS
jgi:hypothetical protein